MSTSLRAIPAEAQDIIGVQRTHTFDVTVRDIAHYHDAIGAPHPQPNSDGDVIAPPLFHHVLMFADVPSSDLRPDGLPPELDIPLPVTHVVGGGAEIEIHKPIRAGDHVTVTSSIEDIYAKTGRSGDLYFVVMVANYVDQNGELLVTERSTYINR